MKHTLSLRFLSAMVTTILLSACAEPETEAPAAPPQMPPPEVDVAPVVSAPISDWKEYTGRLEASKSIVVMPRTSGYVVEVGFEEGTKVEKGDLLFQIDYRTIRAEVERLKAEVERAEAEINLTERDLKRADSLRATNAISQEQLDNRTTLLTQARAAADSARAELRRSQVLDAITTVKAEFDGHVSDARVKKGSSVVAGQTVLTTLVATDQMYAYFDVDEQTYLRLRQQGFDYRNQEISVQMGLSNQSDFPFTGKIDFVDNQINTATGTIRMRAVYDNADDVLTPGLFVRLKMQVGQPYEAIMIDEKAIATDLNNKYVLVVGDDTIANYRPVTLGSRRGDLRVITGGLTAGEKVVVNGLLRAWPGAPVTPKLTEMSANNPSAQQ